MWQELPKRSTLKRRLMCESSNYFENFVTLSGVLMLNFVISDFSK
jgi:hypothetical protein